jgi:DNA repair protein RecO (recombination protein O)
MAAEARSRITHEPAYVLHRYDWSESSLILEVFTRHHGRMALVAKGAKSPVPTSGPVLLPCSRCT